MVSVYPDHVLLAREGRLSLLALPRFRTGGGRLVGGVDGGVPVYAGPPLMDPPVDEQVMRVPVVVVGRGSVVEVVDVVDVVVEVPPPAWPSKPAPAPPSPEPLPPELPSPEP